MHNRLSKVLYVRVSLLHLVPKAACGSIVARRLTCQLIFAYLTIGHTHGEVGIRVVGQILLHTQLGSAEPLLLLCNAVGNTYEVGTKSSAQLDEVLTIDNTRILVE